MKRLFLLIGISFCLNCNNSAQRNSKIFETILSKKYNLEFSIVSIWLNGSNIENPEKITGQITRDNEYIYSKSSFGLGIKQDSLSLYVDDSLKMISLDGPLTFKAKLLIPFYDPLAIYDYAMEHSNSYNKQIRSLEIKHIFKFPDTIPVIQILLIENKKKKSFVIEFTYHSLNDRIKDIINYQIISNVDNKEVKKIKDFIQEENGQFLLKPEFKDYSFFNALPLEYWFKKDTLD